MKIVSWLAVLIGYNLGGDRGSWREREREEEKEADQ
jgi:hypothetical protein